MAGSAAGQAPAAKATPKSREVVRQPLPEPFTEREARFVEVSYPAGSASPPHRHAVFVLGYVIEGEFRFGIGGETPRDLPAGQASYEPPGALHTVSSGARPDQAAKILAVIIAPADKV